MNLITVCLRLFVISLINWNLITCDEAPVIQKSSATLNIVAGQKFKLVCSLSSGSVPVEFSWFKNNDVIVAGNPAQIKSVEEDNSVLTISSISPNDAGLYKCIAKNSAGSDFNEVQVIVKGKNAQNLLIY
jgi:Down syndrome cell adhesion protein